MPQPFLTKSKIVAVTAASPQLQQPVATDGCVGGHSAVHRLLVIHSLSEDKHRNSSGCFIS